MGRFPGWILRDAVEEVARTVSIRDITRSGVLWSADTLKLSWSKRFGMDNFEVKICRGMGDSLELAYSLADQNREENAVQSKVSLLRTPSNLGRGFRVWFQCPGIVGGEACWRRVAILYLPEGAEYFACRYCHGLSYWLCLHHKSPIEVLARAFKPMGGKTRWEDRN